MKKIILLTICLAFATFSFSQQLSRQVVSSGGNYSTNGGYSNSSTIGESMVRTLTSASYILTEGFQQSLLILTFTSTDTIVACDTYTWIDGNTYTSSNNTATHTLTNSAGYDSIVTLDLTINSVTASISQSGDSLFAVTNPVGLNANWYNIQTEDTTTRIWLMEENTSSFSPRFDCSYFIVVSNNGCTDTSFVHYYAENASRIGSVFTSPNPTSGLINVKFDNPKNQFVKFELINNNGSKLDEFITLDNNLNVDLSNYPSGSYYLYFNSEDAVQGCRLEEVQKVSTKIILNK